MDLERANLKWFLDLNELEELRNDAYLNSKIAKERSKKWHDQMMARKIFQQGDKVLLYDSKLHIFLGKLKSRWIGPFTIHQFFPKGVVELLCSNENKTFKVNGRCLKPYAVPFGLEKEELTLLEIKTPEEWDWVDPVSLEIVQSISFCLIFYFIFIYFSFFFCYSKFYFLFSCFLYEFLYVYFCKVVLVF